MKRVTFLASLIAALSFMLISADRAHAHPGCQGVGLEDKEDCDGDADRQLLEEEEGEEEEELRALVEDDCEDDDAERVVPDDCEDDEDAERVTLDHCDGDDADGGDCEGEGDGE